MFIKFIKIEVQENEVLIMVFIPFLFLKAFFSMASQHIESFMLILAVLFLLTLPLGYLIIKAFRLFSESGFFDKLLLSFGIGLGIVLILCLWTMLIKFNALLITTEIILVDVALFWYCWKNKLFFSKTALKGSAPRYLTFLVFGFLILMFAYYSLVPLTTELAMFRDYDLIAWGIQENSALKLPVYDVKTYYPPGSSLITALINLTIPQVHIPKIMLNLAYFFAFYLFLLFYQIGNLGFNNKYLGLFFMLAWAISPVSRNFVTDGATIPGNTSAIFGLFFLLLMIFFFRSQKKRYLIMASLMLGVIAFSHIDGLLVFLWLVCALILGKLLFSNRPLFQTFYLLSIITIFSLVIAAPYLLWANNGKTELINLWTEEKWIEHAKGEIHPKPLSEIMFFSGRWLFWLSLLGIPYLFYLLFKFNGWQKIITFSLLLWPILLFSSNNLIFMRFIKPFFLFYALNIIMWFGIAIPIALIVGFGFEGIRNILLKHKILTILFFILLFCVVLIKILDYETINKENVFDSQQGFFMHSFAQRNAYYNQGDLNLINWLKNQEFDGQILNPDGWISFQLPIITKKNAVTIFLHHFYDSISDINLAIEYMKPLQEIFYEPFRMEQIPKEYIKYIFIPSSYTFNKTLIESYEVVQRENGAKILILKPSSNLKHYEIENYFSKVQIYSYPLLIEMRTVQLDKNRQIKIPLEDINKSANFYKLYIKHLTFLMPLPIQVKVGEKSFQLNKVSNKLTWSESFLILTQEELNKAKWNIELIGLTDGIDLKIKKYLPEVDWIEIESFS